MWKLSRNRVLLDEPPEEEDVLRGASPASAAAPAPVRARVGTQVRAAGCSGGEVQVHGVVCRVRSWQGPDASRGFEVTGPGGPLRLVAGSRRSWAPEPACVEYRGDAYPGHWPAALPFALLPQGLGGSA